MRAYERFLEYVEFPSASSEESTAVPSTEEQWAVAKYLKAEMERLGFEEIFLDKYCRLYGAIPATVEEAPTLGFIAHMDLSPASPCQEIKPEIIKYEGGTVRFRGDPSLTMDMESIPCLKDYIGCNLIITDGTTLLGADDKAGIAEIMTMAEKLLADKSLKHGRIAVAFTPDEEIGRGADFFDFDRFGADFAFTVDGEAFGELSFENFNAASAEVHFTGRSVHPGMAKNIMLNAQLLAMEFFGLLPAWERPEHTEGRDGFFMLTDSSGTVEKACQKYIIRDHDAQKLEKRCLLLAECADWLNRKYGERTVTATITQGYRNMREITEKHPELTELADASIKALGGTPCHNPIRGGTDGAVLSFQGLPCPNLGTGGHNCHGRMEFAVIEEMDKITEQLLWLAQAAATMKKPEQVIPLN